MAVPRKHLDSSIVSYFASAYFTKVSAKYIGDKRALLFKRTVINGA